MLFVLWGMGSGVVFAGRREADSCKAGSTAPSPHSVSPPPSATFVQELLGGRGCFSTPPSQQAMQQFLVGVLGVGGGQA